MRWSPELDALAASQHWLLTTHQLRDAGVGDRTIKRWVAEGRLERRQPGVVARHGIPRTRQQDLNAALLSAGPAAAASHRSALAEWEIDRCGQHLVELTIARPRNSPPRGAIVHRLTDLAENHVTMKDGYRITTPARALVDSGAVLPPFIVERCTGRAIADGLCTETDIAAVLVAVARRGRAGAGVMREILATRAPEDPLERATALETGMGHVIRDHDLPRPVFQHPVYVDNRLIRIDFAYVALMLAIEVDGYRWHRTPEQVQNDDERQNLLTELGWKVLRFTWADVMGHPRRTARQIQRVLARLSSNSV